MSMQFHHYSVNGANSSASGARAHLPDEKFLCLWTDVNGLHCGDLIHGTEASAHLRGVHGIHGSDACRVYCQWDSCNREINKESLARHVQEVHMGIGYSCNLCGTTFSRKDGLNKHMKASHVQH